MASSGGTVTGQGDSYVMKRGLCWSTSEMPTIDNDHKSNGSGTGSFTIDLTDLSPHTIYYIRAYATNEVGTGYGNQVSFTTTSEPPVNIGLIAYWKFENNADDEVGNFNPGSNGIIDINYVNSYTAEMGKAASFNGETSLIRIPNGDQLDDTHDFTIAFWVKPDGSQHGQFVMGLAGWFGFHFEIAGDFSSCKLAAQYEMASGYTISEDIWFNGEPLGQYSWQGWTYSNDLTNSGGVNALLANKWAHIVCRYNSESKEGTMYINGEKMKEQDFDLWPEGDPKTTTIGLKYAGDSGNNTFVFGFIQDYENPTIIDSWADYFNPDNNHFKGLLDNVRIYHKALSELEISTLYSNHL